MKRILITLLVFCAALVASAEVFAFDFTGQGSDFDFEAKAGVISTNGITMTFKAYESTGSNTELNGAAGDFGINDLTTPDDDADRLETGEYLTIEFSSALYTSIELQTITLDVFSSSSDAGYYQIGSGSQVSFEQEITTLSFAGEVLGSGNTLKISSTEGNFSLDGISITAIPEPVTIAMFGIGGIIAFIISRASRR